MGIYNKDSSKMIEVPDSSVDLMATDPPYGIGFMGKDWDKALPDKGIWAECFRVMKPGSFAFVMSIPRADCLSRMIMSLEDAGFSVNFTPIFWTYATGFPKAQNIGKAVDKRLGVKSKVLGQSPNWRESKRNREQFGSMEVRGENAGLITEVVSPQANALDGSYGGFQPKPAVEVIIVAMKPLSEKTFVDQALKNRKGITWLDDGRIPIEDSSGVWGTSNATCKPTFNASEGQHQYRSSQDPQGRFPANLLVSDDVLNDGKNHNQGGSVFCRGQRQNKVYGLDNSEREDFAAYGDSGSFSRYFDLDKWAQKTFPFLIVPKASKSEKNKGLDDLPEVLKSGLPLRDGSGDYTVNEYGDGSRSIRNTKTKNYHPTVKPIKLMSYLITLGSRAGDTVLDPFAGTMTTGIACQILDRNFIGYELDKAIFEIGKARLNADWQKSLV